MKISVIGRGKTGKHVVEHLEQDDNFTLGEVFHSQNPFKREKGRECDALIAFIDAQALESSWDELSQTACPLILATTGREWSSDERTQLKARGARWLHAHNFATGLNFLKYPLSHLGKLTEASFELTDIHHTHKKDAPSGTAVSMRQWLGRADTKIESIREGDVVGTHILKISLPFETIEITHTSLDRRIFARGAVWAAQHWTRSAHLADGLLEFDKFLELYTQEG